MNTEILENEVRTLKTRRPAHRKHNIVDRVLKTFDVSIRVVELGTKVGELVFVVFLIGIAMRVFTLMGPTAPTP